jgi:hypothetical protein
VCEQFLIETRATAESGEVEPPHFLQIPPNRIGLCDVFSSRLVG